MSVFRPSARVRSPDGRNWEIYAYKVNVRARPAADPADPSAHGAGTGAAELWLVQAALWLARLVPHALLRLVDVAAASIRSLRSDAWTIQAITWAPIKTTYTWTTTREFRGQVLAQVQGHLARGDVPVHLTNAAFRGESR